MFNFTGINILIRFIDKEADFAYYIIKETNYYTTHIHVHDSHRKF